MSLKKESIKRVSRREKRGKLQFVLNKKLSALIMLVLFFVMVSTPTMAQTPDNPNCKQSDIKLSLDSALLVTSSNTSIAIIPGKSQDQKDAEAKAAQEAAAKKAAAAKAQAAAAVKVSTYNDPASFDAIYVAAGNMFGVDPALLKAIHAVETGAGGSTNRTNPSGATGPMQFLPSTFKAHAVDGNGDGIKDVDNVQDAIYTAAAYLKACGYPNMKSALWGYNPSNSYYNRVLSLAKSFGLNS